MPIPTDRDLVVETIATTVLGLETLETRKGDRLDFHELAVWRIKEALEAAYDAGVAAGAEPVRSRDTVRLVRLRGIVDACWPSAMAETFRGELGIPRGSLVVPGWARGLDRDLAELSGQGWALEDAREAVEASWRLRLGLPGRPSSSARACR